MLPTYHVPEMGNETMENEELQSTAPPVDSGKEAADLHVPAPQAVEKRREALVLPVPLGNFMAQLLIPADMSRAEMLRLRRLLWTLAVSRK